MTKRDMSYEEFRKDYFSQHPWGEITRAGIDTCPKHPARARRTVRWRPEVSFRIDAHHITVHVNMNPYYNPEAMGLEPIAELDEDEAYQFHIVAAWLGTITETFKGIRSTTYKIFWAADSGCSCPSPFEDYKTIQDLSYYDGSNMGWQHLLAAVNEVSTDDASKTDFLRKVGQAYKDYCQ
jgi:hypothetical protein